MTSTGNKRRRTSPYSPSILDIIPEILLVKISGYLSKPLERAIFAVALTTHPSDWKKINWNHTPLTSWLLAAKPKKQPSSIAKAILSSAKCDTLDFDDVGFDVASKLSDDDISAVLSSMNAVRHLKKLELPRCVKITGRGLEPLHGSAVLQRINIQHSIRETEALPVLESIINSPGNSLTYIDIISWGGTFGWDAFIRRYKQHLLDQDFQCMKCKNRDLFRTSHSRLFDVYDEVCEIQCHACCKCLHYYCTEETPRACDCVVTYCEGCERSTCSDCEPNKYCTCCNEPICENCTEMDKCNLCQNYVCDRCYQTCKCCNAKGCIECLDFIRCQKLGCYKQHCGNCFEEGTDHDVKSCRYGHKRCFGCRFSKCSKKWTNACPDCLGVMGISAAVASKLQEEKEDTEKEISKLLVENCRLKDANGEI